VPFPWIFSDKVHCLVAAFSWWGHAAKQKAITAKAAVTAAKLILAEVFIPTGLRLSF